MMIAKGNNIFQRIDEMIFEEKISAVTELMKQLKLNFSLDYEDMEGCGYEIVILDPALKGEEV